MKTKALLMLALAAPLMAFAQTGQKATIDFELEELKTDTLFIGTYLASDIDQRNLRLDTIAPGQAKYTYTAEADTTAYNVFVASEEDLSKTIFFALLPGDHFRVTGSLRDCGGQRAERRLRAHTESVPPLSRADGLPAQGDDGGCLQ